MATHTYESAGEYQATLTVTDGEGAQSSTTQPVAVVEAPPIVMTTANAGYLWDPVSREGTVLLSIVTMADGLFVDGATVSGYWTWENKGGKPATMEVTAVSDGSNLGLAEIVTVFKKNQTPMEFCVTDFLKDGYEYVQTDPVCAREFGS